MESKISKFIEFYGLIWFNFTFILMVWYTVKRAKTKRANANMNKYLIVCCRELFSCYLVPYNCKIFQIK